MRVVLDTNCIVSALLFRTGRLTKLRDAWNSRLITPIVCNQTVLKLLRVLAYPKFKLEQSDIEILLSEFLPFTEVVHLPDELEIPVGLQDPDDAVFIHLAIQSHADMLISGDAHLLQLKTPPLPILSPSDLLKQYLE